MLKRILSIFIAICTLLAITSVSVFADETTELKAASKALRANEKEIAAYNDITPEEFLSNASKVLPEGSTVKLSFKNSDADLRIYRATTEKAGSVFANMVLTCGVYTTSEMVTVPIPQLTDTEADSDREKIGKDKEIIENAIKWVYVTNDTTADDILNELRKSIKNGSEISWDTDYNKQDATEKSVGGRLDGTLILTLNNRKETIKVLKTVHFEALAKTDDEQKPADEPKPAEEQKPAANISFTDVKADDYYADAVKWAVEKSITTGTSNTTFSPEDTCTRAQIITFLWRAVGSPKASAANPFGDVKTSDYYYDAAVWASEKGMVSGNAFAGDTPCTRASTVTYLWKNAGSPGIRYDECFDDVSADDDYATAVMWAFEEGVTSGTSETEFSPDAICNRGQIVTFLNRAID